MKRSIIVAFAFLISMTSLMAQKMDNPRVQQLRKEFYGEKLDFSAEESKAFWPVFEQYQAEEKKLRKQYKSEEITSATPDDKAEKILQNHVTYDEKSAELKRNYVNRFKEVLPVRKVAMLDKVERQFKQELLRKYRQRQAGKRQDRN